jgi:hypothetical protein
MNREMNTKTGGKCMICTGICFALIGVIIRSSGANLSAEVDKLNPDLHFTYLGEAACFTQQVILTSVTEKTAQSSSRGSGTSNSKSSSNTQTTSTSQTTSYSYECHDTYVYEVVKGSDLPFVAGQTKTYSIDRSLDTSIRPSQGTSGSDASCESTKIGPAKPTFQENITVECWEATAEMPTERPSLYFCGNPSCLKIFSPYTAEEYADVAAGLISAGNSMLLGAAFVVIVGGLCVGRSSSNKTAVPPPMIATTSNQSKWGTAAHGAQQQQVMMIPQQGGQQQPPQYQQQQQQQPQYQQQPPQYQQQPQQQPYLVQPMQPMQPMIVQPQVVQPSPYAVVAVPQPQIMSVAVPPGAIGGQLIQVQSPDGKVIQVQVPAGFAAGQQFQVQY